MIPADAANQLRLLTRDLPAAPLAPAPVHQVTDVLSNLVPGQRILAEIQALLPNGAYRATIAQRDVTLALPFSAKAGDALELEVVESDGKLTLAFVANRNAAQPGKAGGESVSATLSQTGKLIGDLLGAIDEQGKNAKPAALNGNQPLTGNSLDAAQLAPLLKNALARSGMFYEAHQARWAQGQLPTEALMQEPQGKLSIALHPQARGEGASTTAGLPVSADASTATADSSVATQQKSLPQAPIPSDLAPLVRQQLDALATQNYVWQGQLWPGQQMHWEIEQEKSNRQGDDHNANQQWHTRLKLTLPSLGEIDAVMHLRSGGTLDISLVTNSDESRQRLSAASESLRRQLEDAGLTLTGLAVQHGEISG